MTRKRSATTPKLQETVRLGASGLGKILGDLEARVLESVWRLGVPSPSRAVHADVVRSHDVALLTVITVLNKLVVKRILSRRKVNSLLHYGALMAPEEFQAFASRRLAEGVVDFAPHRMAASIVDVLAERDPAQLDELARLVEEARRRRGQ